MNQYKKKLYQRFFTLLAMVLVFVFVLVVTKANEDTGHLGGFMSGVVSSSGMVLIVYGIRLRKAIKNPETLKKMQIKETDERNVLIVQKVQSGSFSIFVFAIGMLTIAFAFINRDIMYSYSLLLVIACIVKLGLYWYYKRKL